MLQGRFQVVSKGNFSGDNNTCLHLLIIYLKHVAVCGMNSNKKPKFSS